MPRSGGHPMFYEILGSMSDLHSRKNHDYSTAADPLSNLRMSEKLGIPAHKGCFIRMGDKFARLEQLLGGKESQVKEESVEDTLQDLAVYSILCLILYRERLQAPKENSDATIDRSTDPAAKPFDPYCGTSAPTDHRAADGLTPDARRGHR